MQAPIANRDTLAGKTHKQTSAPPPPAFLFIRSAYVNVVTAGHAYRACLHVMGILCVWHQFMAYNQTTHIFKILTLSDILKSHIVTGMIVSWAFTKTVK